ncbi:MAG TPA: SEL1-like repeat protein [Xanthobacteraceae bacterium]|nr:SEL1-like repeat protein [Xanthobacteraceae bacterium]
MSIGATQSQDQAVSFGAGAEEFYRLGLMYSTGETVPADMVTAHKWFNIAAMRGSREAVRHRRDLAQEMSSADIAAAQRAARSWLTRH